MTISSFAERVADLTGAAPAEFIRLAGGDLSQLLLIHKADGRAVVAKASPVPATEAAMLRSLLSTGVPAPMVEGEFDGVLLLEYVPNDALFSPATWRDIAMRLRQLHANQGEAYGWPADYRIGTVELDNRSTTDWPEFWGRQRLVATAAMLDRPWRNRIEQLCGRLPDLLPAAPPPAHLHGDLWTGNILVKDGAVAALIDPACYYGDAEIDLAMLALFATPPDEFWACYGGLAPGWKDRRATYQLFPALVHLRLFGTSYAPMVDRLLNQLGA